MGLEIVDGVTFARLDCYVEWVVNSHLYIDDRSQRTRRVCLHPPPLRLVESANWTLSGIPSWTSEVVGHDSGGGATGPKMYAHLGK